MAKEKKYLIDNPVLMAEWDWEKNDELGLDITKLTCGMNIKVNWRCKKCGYSWITTINNRNIGTGCPQCSQKQRSITRRKPKQGKGMLDIRPELIEDWDFEGNNISPKELNAGSDTKVWWKCHICGHSWQTSVCNRAKLNRNCPNCAKLSKGVDVILGKIKKTGSLADNYPELIKEWNFNKNSKPPQEYMPNSRYKVWWICPICGNEWESKISHRVKGVGCPLCATKKAKLTYVENKLQNSKSFGELHPELLIEWDYSKNTDIDPFRVFEHSNQKVWWLCKKGHSYKTSIHVRVSGCGCNQCQKEHHTSFPEKSVFFYIKQIFNDTVENYKTDYLGKMEFDIFIPSLNVAIEYDGGRWHNDLRKDLKKNQVCEENCIKLFRIREKHCPLDSKKYTYITYFHLQNESLSELERVIKDIVYKLNFVISDINIERDSVKIMQLLEMSEKRNSLAVAYPSLATEWNYSKNGNLKPEYVSSKSNKKVWWVCSKGHEWQATIYSRTSGTNCPFCSGQKILIGFNDLQTTHTELCQEWNYEKNIDIKPTNVSKGSNKKVWWKCDNGHEWQATISSRVHGNGCPICYKGKRKK